MTDKMRAEFEAWYAPIFCAGSPANMLRRNNGEYLRDQHQIAWMSWQARGAAMVPMTEAEILDLAIKHRGSHLMVRFARAIETHYGIGARPEGEKHG